MANILLILWYNNNIIKQSEVNKLKTTKDFGTRLKELRLEKGMTQTELGKVFDFSKSGIYNWENRTREPKQEILKQMSDYFDVNIDYLIGITDIRNNVILKTETESFTVKLVQELLSNKIISDPDNISQNIIDMVILALKQDLEQNKKR